MTDTKLMISTLRQGKTGTEILLILNSITDDSVENVMQTVVAVGDTITTAVNPTLEEIAF